MNVPYLLGQPDDYGKRDQHIEDDVPDDIERHDDKEKFPAASLEESPPTVLSLLVTKRVEQSRRTEFFHGERLERNSPGRKQPPGDTSTN